MTKRILALLLAILLLPAAALAEAFRLDVTVEMTPETATDVIRQSGMFAGSDNEEDLAAAFVDFMDGFAVHLLTQEDALRLDVAFDETTLLDLSVLLGGEDLVITSDMMSGAGFSVPMAMMSVPEDDALMTLLQGAQWETLLTGMLASAVNALQGVEITTTRGSFAGDAFSGGVYCTTVILDDADVAALLDALLTPDVRTLIGDLFASMELDGAAMLDDFDVINAKALQDNAHRYILRLVYDAQNALIGISATLLQGESQLATLSVGWTESTLRIVAGLPMDSVNYWHCHDISWTTSMDGDVEHLVVTGALKEFTADKALDFASGSVHTAESKLHVQWSADLGHQSGNYTWLVSVSQRAGDSIVMDKTEYKGLYMPGARFANTTTSSRSGKVWMTERMVWAPCDPIDASGDGLILCDLMNPEEAVLSEITMTMAYELAARLMQVIPMQLLLYLQ